MEEHGKWCTRRTLWKLRGDSGYVLRPESLALTEWQQLPQKNHPNWLSFPEWQSLLIVWSISHFQQILPVTHNAEGCWREGEAKEWASVLQLQLQNHWHWLPALSHSCDCNWTKPQTKTFHYLCFGSMHSVKEKNKTGSIILLSPYFFSGKLKFQFWSGPKSSFKSSSE